MKSGVQVLLAALRRTPTDAGVAALRRLAPLVFAVAHEDAEVALEFLRIVGSELGEHTPCNLLDAAILAANLDSPPIEARARLLLADELHALDHGRRLLRDAGPVAVSAPFVTALAEADQISTRLNRRLLAADLGLPRRARGAAWDPLVRQATLAEEVGARLFDLAAMLSALHDPIAVGVDEALAVAGWSLGLPGIGPPRREALLRFARCLDELMARAPLGPEELERLQILASAADQERGDGWDLMVTRLTLLRPRLRPGALALAPIERVGLPRAAPRRALSLEHLVRDGESSKVAPDPSKAEKAKADSC